MKRDDWLWILGGAAVLAALYYYRQPIGAAVTAAIAGWQAAGEGPTWVPVINQTEAALGIPTNLLARMAYEESHFRQDIISGAVASPTGALGILQLEPQFFPTVRVPVPFSTDDTMAQISEAGGELARLYGVFQDWGLAIAAYNDGEGNIRKYLTGTRALPQETKDYVAQVLADVPVGSSLSA